MPDIRLPRVVAETLNLITSSLMYGFGPLVMFRGALWAAIASSRRVSKGSITIQGKLIAKQLKTTKGGKPPRGK